jgi:hypothetical protein
MSIRRQSLLRGQKPISLPAGSPNVATVRGALGVRGGRRRATIRECPVERRGPTRSHRRHRPTRHEPQPRRHQLRRTSTTAIPPTAVTHGPPRRPPSCVTLTQSETPTRTSHFPAPRRCAHQVLAYSRLTIGSTQQSPRCLLRCSTHEHPAVSRESVQGIETAASIEIRQSRAHCCL